MKTTGNWSKGFFGQNLRLEFSTCISGLCSDEIESVNIRMLERLVDKSPFLAVFFCKKSRRLYLNFLKNYNAIL